MQRKILLIILLALCTTAAFSKHLKGGWIHYEYLGKGVNPNTSKYRITVNQYLLCASTEGQIDPEVYVGIFDAATNALTTNLPDPVLTIEHTSVVNERRTDFDPCISNPPSEICYRIDSYVAIEDLPDNTAGYILGVQRCCRIEGLANLVNSEAAGITYSVTIPGFNLPDITGVGNNSPIFKQNDVAVLCINSPFTLDFGAVDSLDHDSLSFSLCSGLIGGDNSNTQQGTQPNPPSNPPFLKVNYSSGFSGAQPLGSGATIDSKTGVISGNAPSKTGDYVVAVCVTEYRNGVAIANSRKEIHISVASCVVEGASLKPSYSTCDGYTFTFENQSTASNIESYIWSFGFNDSTDTIPTPTITFPAAGDYQIKLKVKNGGLCVDSASSVLKVYPGFHAAFSVAGSCLAAPFDFTDKSTTLYGVVDSWKWDFGELSNTSDTSDIKSPVPYQYKDTGEVTARLIVTNSKGCIDTAVQTFTVYDKPLLTLPFHDTLICNIDQLQLSAASNLDVSYTWTPLANITSANTATPTVKPPFTTTYYVNISDKNGCANSDSVLVNVIDQVSLQMPPDTIVCLTDTIQLQAKSNGLNYQWTPTQTLSSDTAKQPFTVPVDAVTPFHLVARIGGCINAGNVTVRTAPYPTAVASETKSICFGATTQLNASYTGTGFTWSPVNSLLNANTSTPTAGPPQTTTYTFTAVDASVDGCPKPVSDTVTIVVIPPVKVFAGRDTNIVVGQSLQLQATGATFYHWTPATSLNNSNIANPILSLPSDIVRIIYMVRGTTAEGCSGTDSLTVYQFKTLPEIFVPSAFTPDGDGVNDIIKPIVAGMKKLEYFRIYDRWGALMYVTSSVGQGWDGIYKGEKQLPGTYVYAASAIDYADRRVERKGTVVLIR